MYPRLFNPKSKQSYFLLGPRGTGKTTFLKKNYPKAVYIDLLDSKTRRTLSARPESLLEYIPPHFKGWVIIDEVQKVPEILNEVHRLIESKAIQFILTGSSARKLRKQGVNLLAGRALTYRFHPLTIAELGSDFNLKQTLTWGLLPMVFSVKNKEAFLNAYAGTYINEEVREESMIRNLGMFSRFLEAMAMSNANVLSVAPIARELGVDNKTVESYIRILEDMMLAIRIPVFSKRAKRRLLKHEKFYFFDCGIFRILRPLGPLDSIDEMTGTALETLVLHELRALNDYLDLGYKLFFWRTPQGNEVDFVLYGKSGLVAIEVKKTARLNDADFSGLDLFLKDYPEGKGYLFYGGDRKIYRDKITAIPVTEALKQLKKIIS